MRYLGIVILFTCCARTFACTEPLYPFYDETQQKYGYVSRLGTTVVAPKFLRAYDFSDGLGRVEIGTEKHPLLGFIDCNGIIAITPQFGNLGDVSEFSEGLSAVLTDNGFAYINRRGDIKIKPSNLAVATNPPLNSFSEGIAAVYTSKGVVLINARGERLLKSYFAAASSFHGGVAQVTLLDGNRTGIIDRRGRFILGPTSNELVLHADGIVAEHRGRYWYYTSRGSKFLFRSFLEISFSGKAGFFKIDDKYGLMNVAGKVVVPPTFDFVYDFHDDRAVVEIGGRFGAIDGAGNLVVPAKYDALNLHGFKNGLITFQLKDVVGYLDENGSVIWQSKALEALAARPS